MVEPVLPPLVSQQGWRVGGAISALMYHVTTAQSSTAHGHKLEFPKLRAKMNLFSLQSDCFRSLVIVTEN